MSNTKHIDQYKSNKYRKLERFDYPSNNHQKKQNRKYFNIMIGLLVLVIFIIAITTMGSGYNTNITNNIKKDDHLLDLVTTYGQGRTTGLMRID